MVRNVKTFARIEAGIVAELLRTEVALADLFHPALRWVEVVDPAVAPGWVEADGGLVPSSVASPMAA
jgi:hypothetical protein